MDEEIKPEPINEEIEIEEKTIEASKKEHPKEEKKENIFVIKKSTLFIIAAVIIIVIVGIIVLRIIGFFDSENGNSTDNIIEMIASDSPILGDSGTIYLVEFSDYECPYCQAAEGTNFQVISSLKQRDPTWEAPVPKVIEEYVDTGKVKLVFRQYPIHANAKKAAEAAKCAQEQGKFWEYHQTLFEKYDALSITDLKKYASDLNLDLNQFNQCLDSGKYLESVQNDMNDGKGVGVSGTPTFFIGNEENEYEIIVGAQSFSKFQEIIESKISV